MAIRKVARMGHPVLRKKARELSKSEILSESTRNLVRDMVETMNEYGGIGIAAPQIHESLSIAIIDYQEDGASDQPLTVVINPKITVLDPTEQGNWEGCLSVPELRGLVYRPRKVQIDYLDLKAQPQTIVAEDFLATVFQHELDHLFGVLFVDRVRFEPGKSPISFTEEYSRYHAPEEDDEVGELED
jgi:peptide deformylase